MGCQDLPPRRRQALAAIAGIAFLSVALVIMLVPDYGSSKNLQGSANGAGTDFVDFNDDDMPTTAPEVSVVPEPVDEQSPPSSSENPNSTNIFFEAPTAAPQASIFDDPTPEREVIVTQAPIASIPNEEDQPEGGVPAPEMPAEDDQPELDTPTQPVPTNAEPAPTPRPLRVDDFQPLPCNSDLDSAVCKPWSQVMSRQTGENMVTIPCGTCVTMDVPFLRLERGLDIQGKLVVPDGVSWAFETSMIVVQGEWEMRSTGIIQGEPAISITLFGNENRTFFPATGNDGICGPTGCEVGPQSVTVAGGKVDFNGAPRNLKTWTHLHDVSNDGSTLTLAGVSGTWGADAEIVVTSTSRRWDGDQPRTISGTTSATARVNDALSQIELDSPLLGSPTTVLQSQDFAVEVALVSRNIVFQGEANGGGAHLWIYHTPYVQQQIRGIQVKNFGQQGNLGRYPIHFHLCSDVSGSVVAQNSIYQSNQRCMVVHGTDNLLVEENVSYDTKGHCFLVEDGIEKDNMFMRNIAIRTGVPEVLIPNLGDNGNETDHLAASFWLTSAANDMVGNVAAGSQIRGIWYELLARGPRSSEMDGIDPMKVPMGRFDGNVVHSSHLLGVTWYQDGYRPETIQEVRNLKVYRNNLKGLRFHRTRNLAVHDSLFADNPINFEIDRAEEVHIYNSTFIGYSDSVRKMVASGATVPPCRGSDGSLVGITLQSTTPTPGRIDTSFDGLIVDGAVFSQFNTDDCPGDVDPVKLESRTDNFDTLEMFNSVKNVSPSLVDTNYCTGKAAGVDDFYIVDQDGSLSSDNRNVAATLMVDSGRMQRFVDQNKCQWSRPEKCTIYCPEVCFRTINYYLPEIDATDKILRVCSKSMPNLCQESSGRRGLVLNTAHRFAVHIPQGEYKATFFHVNRTSEEYIPQTLHYSTRDPLCPLAPVLASITLNPSIDLVIDKGTGDDEIRGINL